MNKNNLKKICSVLLVSILTFSIGNMTVSATQESSEITQLEQKYNLEKETEVPEGVIPFKFETTAEAEKFIKLLKENEDKGDLTLPSYVLERSKEVGYIDLSNTNLSKENFIKTASTIPAQSSYNPRQRINTVEHKKIPINGGMVNMNIEVEATYLWKSDIGNYYSSYRGVNSYLTGLYFGNSWTQTSSAVNITNRGKTLNATVRGKWDYYILIDTSLTSIAGKTKTYSASWTLR